MIKENDQQPGATPVTGGVEETGAVQPDAAGDQAESSAKGDLAVQLEEARKTAEAYKDQLLRKAAEFENYKRRTEAEYLSLMKSAGEGVLASLLPVVEDLSRSLKAAADGTVNESFVKGVELIYQKLIKVLDQQGLRPFDSLGKPFDVHFHDALLQVPREDVPPGTVIEEVERGYMLHDRVLRHAKVVVSTSANGAGSPGDAGSNETPEA
jgi:molecular chaperone GrpE